MRLLSLRSKKIAFGLNFQAHSSRPLWAELQCHLTGPTNILSSPLRKARLLGMVLAQAELRTSVEAKEIGFDPPLEENQWGQASVDLRLGFSFTKIKKDLKGVNIADGLGVLGDIGFWTTIELRERDEFGKLQSFFLEPGEFVLAMTYERITVPSNMVAIVEGRSTYARAGISMHQTAPWIQPGWDGSIVLEMVNQGPLTIELTPKKDRPCQLSFFKLTSTLPDELLYGSRPTDSYQSQTHPLKRRR